MAEIVGAVGLPHTPYFPMLVAQGGPLAEEIKDRYGRIGEALEAMRADAVVFFLPDHYAEFFEIRPTFDVAVADAGWGPADYPEQEQRRVPIPTELAAAVHRDLLAAGFDPSRSLEPRLDHSSLVPITLVGPPLELPLVPIRISTFTPPLPRADRCLALGRAVGDAVRASGAGRVAVATTGNFSLDIGGPRMSETSFTSIPAPDWVERVAELMRAGDLDSLVAEATPEQLAEAGMEAGELLLWIAMLGTFPPQPAEYVDTQPAFGQAFAVWNLEQEEGS